LKKFSTFAIAALLAVSLTACGGGESYAASPQPVAPLPVAVDASGVPLPQQYQPQYQQPQQHAKEGVGAGTAAAAGVIGGGLLGYMMGKSSTPKQSTVIVNQQQIVQHAPAPAYRAPVAPSYDRRPIYNPQPRPYVQQHSTTNSRGITTTPSRSFGGRSVTRVGRR
jgi:hypothetical protein